MLEQVRPEYGLSAEQIDFYENNGYVGPLELCSEAEMLSLRDWMDQSGMFTSGGASPIYGRAPSGRACMRDWHLVYREMYDLCTHPMLSETMASIMGPDLVLWRSQVQYKDAGHGPVAWHQDLGFPGHLLRPALNPVKNISAWIAIEEATLANGCVRLVPGTHRGHIERRMKTAERGEGLFGRQYRMEYVVDTSKAIAMVMRPGQFFLFSESTLHGSTANPTKKRRLGFSVRVTTPEVKVYEGQTIDGTGYNLEKFRCVLMRGEDRYHHNAYFEPKF
ncbi:MAG: phytanoyl-CoA dioxygenase family protein [Acidobacteria bacterium]|nr:phytanoyl-CoA dioxygenase family protein [Acidobacteriota bacterium]